jgi:glutamine amidotransferase
MIVIVDYGLGNIQSIKNAVKHVGYECELSRDKYKILDANYLILPGVGAFKEGMKNIRAYGLEDVLISYANSGRPMLGICLGYQLMTRSSEEFGFESGLGIIPADCKKLNPGPLFRLPNIGWAPINFLSSHQLDNYFKDKLFYFVHSYGVFLSEQDSCQGFSTYGNQDFISYYHKDNIQGVQFHPEKSGANGLDLLHKFLKMDMT